jgi:hypothetical protein
MVVSFSVRVRDSVSWILVCDDLLFFFLLCAYTKVDEDYEVVGGKVKNHNGRHGASGLGSPSSIASNGSSIISHLPSVEG